MKLELDTGSLIDDPSPAQIADAVQAMPGRGEGAFAILSKADEWFIQAAFLAEPGGRPGGFLLEYREGSLASHFRCVTVPTATADVVRAFQGYANGRDDYKRELTWRQLEAAQRREWLKLVGIVGLVLILIVVAGVVARLLR